MRKWLALEAFRSGPISNPLWNLKAALIMTMSALHLKTPVDTINLEMFFLGSLPYRIHTEAKWNFKESELKLQILFWTGGGPLENGWGSMGLGSLPNWTRIQSKKAACSQKHDLRDSGSGADRGNSNKRETAKCPLGWRREQELMPRCQMFDLNSDATYAEFKFDSAIWFNFRFRHRSG